MKKVPITEVINQWLKADNRIEDLCREEGCKYHSQSAYRGFMLGFEAGVNSQLETKENTN